ncbi:MAG: GNAT family N-acetyltransferase, partial [Actinomycetes bacterium]
DLRRDGLHHQGWYAEDGSLVAYGWVGLDGGSSKVELDAYVHPDHDASLGVELVADLERRGADLASAVGHHDVVYDTAAYREDDRTQKWLRARGFEIGTTFTRMRIDLDSSVDLSDAHPAITRRESDNSEDELRVAHALDEESFAGHYGHVPKTFEQWRARLVEHGPGWARLWLAETDGMPVGLLIGTRQFEDTDDAGYVRRLGVVPAGRGKGVAKALLRTYFEAARAEGRTAVLLHVDVANVTGALALYESVGMRAVLQMDAFVKRSP